MSYDRLHQHFDETAAVQAMDLRRAKRGTDLDGASALAADGFPAASASDVLERGGVGVPGSFAFPGGFRGGADFLRGRQWQHAAAADAIDGVALVTFRHGNIEAAITMHFEIAVLPVGQIAQRSDRKSVV